MESKVNKVEQEERGKRTASGGRVERGKWGRWKGRKF